MTSQAIIEEVIDRTLVITINRPEAKNAINGEASRGIASAVERLDASADLTVAVLTGAGGSFCAGMDLKAFLAGEDIAVKGRGLGMTEGPPAKPIIAAIEGHALAGGLELALACDLIVAARDAKFGIPEVKRGLVAGGGGLIKLPARVPYSIAMEMALTGKAFSAEAAHRFGLVNIISDPGSALAAAMELAAEIAANGPLAVRASKQVIVESRDWSAAESGPAQLEIIKPIFDSVDAKEGARAFAEKRAPVWHGK